MNIGVILAGGTGTRIGAGIPKQFIKVLDKPILAYTIELFQNNKNIDAVEVVVHKDWVNEVDSIIEKYGFTKVKWITIGGSTFQESTKNGINGLKGKVANDDVVVISFGVAPMTTDEEIDDSIFKAHKYGNGISAAPMDLLLCEMDDDEGTTQNICREKVRGFANPWSFKYGELLDVYSEGERLGILDTIEPHITSLYLALGRRLWFSKNDRRDIKITYKGDLDTFEGYLLLKAKREAEAKENSAV